MSAPSVSRIGPVAHRQGVVDFSIGTMGIFASALTPQTQGSHPGLFSLGPYGAMAGRLGAEVGRLVGRFAFERSRPPTMLLTTFTKLDLLRHRTRCDQPVYSFLCYSSWCQASR